jgi:hypothetical protein
MAVNLAQHEPEKPERPPLLHFARLGNVAAVGSNVDETNACPAVYAEGFASGLGSRTDGAATLAHAANTHELSVAIVRRLAYHQ